MDFIDDIALTLQPEIGCKTAIHLIEKFGSAKAIFSASIDELVEIGELKKHVAEALLKKEYHYQAEEEVAFVRANNANIICATDEKYPQRLKECNDYPHVIYTKGDVDFNKGRFIAIVGTRKTSTYGQNVCDKLIEEIAKFYDDVYIVSGLAYGVDIEAHRAALRNNVPTISVFGTPINTIYPTSHAASAEGILNCGGALVTEFHSKYPIEGSNFVKRNRIIAGLCDATIIALSPKKGGSLITAQMADGYNRVVMAVPGRIDDKLAEGTNNLIRNMKAHMICSALDIGEILGWEQRQTIASQDSETNPDIYLDTDSNEGAKVPKGSKQYGENVLSETQYKVFKKMERGFPISIDELSETTELETYKVLGALLELEFIDLVKSLPGNMFEKR